MKTLEDFRLAGHALTETCLVPSKVVTREAAKRKHRALWRADVGGWWFLPSWPMRALSSAVLLALGVPKTKARQCAR